MCCRVDHLWPPVWLLVDLYHADLARSSPPVFSPRCGWWRRLLQNVRRTHTAQYIPSAQSVSYLRTVNSSPCTDGPQRPDIHAPILNMEIMQPELTTPGYIFMSPYHNKDPGPYIYDNYGVCFSHSVACIDSDLVVESCLVVFCAERTQDRPQSTRLQLQGRGPYLLLPGSAASRFRAGSWHNHGQTLPRCGAGRDFRRHVLQ